MEILPLPLARLVQVVLALTLSAAATTLSTGIMVRVLCAFAAIAFVFAAGHQFAHVTADDEGLYVTRYMKAHQVKWLDVMDVQTSLNGITISFRHPVAGWREAVVGIPNLQVRRAFAVIAGREELEIMLWMRERIRDARERALSPAQPPA